MYSNVADSQAIFGKLTEKPVGNPYKNISNDLLRDNINNFIRKASQHIGQLYPKYRWVYLFHMHEYWICRDLWFNQHIQSVKTSICQGETQQYLFNDIVLCRKVHRLSPYLVVIASNLLIDMLLRYSVIKQRIFVHNGHRIILVGDMDVLSLWAIIIDRFFDS